MASCPLLPVEFGHWEALAGERRVRREEVGIDPVHTGPVNKAVSSSVSESGATSSVSTNQAAAAESRRRGATA